MSGATQGHLADSHAHLTDPGLPTELPTVLARARAAGVELIVTIGLDRRDSEACAALAAKQSIVLAAVGIHPHESALIAPGDVELIRDLCARPRVVAVGEIGLDYYRNHSPRDAQLRVFEAQLGVAAETGLPVVVHDRDAHEDIESILFPWAKAWRRARPDRPAGVLHCFSGDLQMAERAIAAGLMISFAGNLTYTKSDALREVAERLPLQSILIETDSPYLAPAPRRGTRNEPALIVHTAQRLAQLRDLSLSEVAAATMSNTRRLFGQAPESTLSPAAAGSSAS